MKFTYIDFFNLLPHKINFVVQVVIITLCGFLLLYKLVTCHWIYKYDQISFDLVIKSQFDKHMLYLK